MRQLLKDRSFRLSIILTLIFFGTGLAFLFLGLSELGWILFILLPLVLGISIGALPNRKLVIFGAIVATGFTLWGMYVLGLSGLLCILFVLPLLFVPIFVGAIIIHLVKRYGQLKSTSFSVLLFPLLPFLIAAPTEHFLKNEKEAVVTVKTERVFDFSPEQVFDAIKSVDTLDAERTWLMYFDLPIPTRCVLEKEEIGGLRTCYFKPGNMSNADFGAGTIVERITELERGKVLKMDVIDYTLVGRNWLGFREAIYYFDKVGVNKCRMIRITTYTSVLNPRFYWEPLERLGIEQEHEFVFKNLEKDLTERYEDRPLQ